MAAESNYHPIVSLAEYLAHERQSSVKHEYLDGMIYMMAGASLRHLTLVGNIQYSLTSQLRSRGCGVHSSDLRIKTPSGLVAYPDIVVVCGQPELLDEHGDILLNPVLLVEVLSPSTALYDRGSKFIHYRSLPSLQSYVVVAQDRPLVEVYDRGAAQVWLPRYEIDLSKALALPSIDSTLPLAEVYANVTFESG